MRCYVDGIGVLGPGLRNWTDAQRLLAGRAAYDPAPTVLAATDLLPAGDRRRASVPVKLALAAGNEAFRNAARDPAATPCVFASSSADPEILHRICDVLTTPEREVSPTTFMNSVHNAAAGYWSIAMKCREPLTSLCAYDGSFAAGLLEAAAAVAADERPVGLIAYDQPYPQPIHSCRPLEGNFAVALLLGCTRNERTAAAIEVELTASTPTLLSEPALERLRAYNPAARSLPLLAAIAAGGMRDVVLPYLEDRQLAVRVAA
jgi:Beta-ketoacyl synthase, N-terminal domain